MVMTRKKKIRLLTVFYSKTRNEGVKMTGCDCPYSELVMMGLVLKLNTPIMVRQEITEVEAKAWMEQDWKEI
jgi:hypothetical protein